MAITTAERNQIIELTVLMFNAAPGATYLSQIVALYESNGRSLQTLANQLATTSAFTSLHPNFETAEEFAAEFLTPLGLQNDTVAKDFVIAKFNAGVSKGQIMYEGYVALNAVPSTGAAQYVAANAILNNKTTVAEYYSVTKGGTATDLTTLQATINNVTADAASVTAAKAVIDGAAAGGQTFTLTAGVDEVVGTAGDDVVDAFTVNASGTAAETFSAFDAIDGAAGNDTLNIYTTGTENEAFPASASVKNVETVNIFNTGAAAAYGDASKFVGATQLWQHNTAADVTNLASTTIAGFKGVATTAAADLSATAATAATSVAVSLDGVKGTDVATIGTFDAGDNTAHLAVGGAAVNSVTVGGTLAQAVVSTASAAAASLTLTATAGKDVETLTVNTGVKTTLVVAEGAGTTKEVKTVDASTSTGGVTYAGLVTGGANVYTIKTGAGADAVTIATATVKDVATTTADETVSALVETGAGKDSVTVATTGDGTTTVNAGDGDDTVSVTGRGTGVLTVNLGAGKDSFSTTAVTINATDVIDAGADVDTLLLSLVGSLNTAAFRNFDVYDVKGMSTNLDLDILNASNTVTEIVGSAALGGAVTLTNVAAGVGFRATGDMGTANALTLTQKTAGALTVTLDADETGTADTTIDTASMAVVASNATSVNAVFDTSYLATITGETTAGDNVSTINLSTGATNGAATAITVVSGGANANNVLNVTELGATDALTSVTATGAQALTLTVAGASKLATVDSSGATGGLTFSLADLKDTGSVSLGSGVDTITATNTSTTGAIESVIGFEKAAAISVTTSTAGADLLAQAQAIADADELSLTGAAVANANGAVTTGTIAKGVLTFTGAGPATLDAAIAIADAAAETAGEAVAFEYIGNSYVFVQGATDTVVKLTGVTGVTNFVEEAATDLFFIV